MNWSKNVKKEVKKEQNGVVAEKWFDSQGGRIEERNMEDVKNVMQKKDVKEEEC